MSDKTGIEWTDATWNPIRGCARVSEGCRNCYAERVAARFSEDGAPYAGLIRDGKWNGEVKFVPEHLSDPLRWKRPRRIFVNSMSDLFHENVTDAMIDQIFAVMALCPQHTFQVLTKRPERMRKYMVDGIMVPFSDYVRDQFRREFVSDEIFNLLLRAPFEPRGPLKIPQHVATMGQLCCAPEGWPLPNVWLGVSVEDQGTADARIPELLSTPAAVRFVSYEPALGPVDWRAAALKGGELQGIGIDWLICGGESGAGARPMHPDWARSARDQCQAAGVKFFFKQWGEWAPSAQFCPCNFERKKKLDTHEVLYCKKDGAGFEPIGEGYDPKQVMTFRVGKKAAGRVLDERAWDEMPELQRHGAE